MRLYFKREDGTFECMLCDQISHTSNGAGNHARAAHPKAYGLQLHLKYGLLVRQGVHSKYTVDRRKEMPRWPKKTQQTKEEITATTEDGKTRMVQSNDPLTLRVLEVRYERVFPIPNHRFASERIGITAAVGVGQSVNYVIEQLKRLAIRNSKTGNEDYNKAKAILADKNSFSFRDVSWAEAFMATFEGEK